MASTSRTLCGPCGSRPLIAPRCRGCGCHSVGCWSHTRRKFYELHVPGSQPRQSSGWRSSGRLRRPSAAKPLTSAAIVADLFALWQKTLPRVSGKSRLAEALRYAISRRAIFERFLTDGRIEVDSNIVERAKSGPRPLQERTRSSPAAAEGSGRPSRGRERDRHPFLCKFKHSQCSFSRRC